MNVNEAKALFKAPIELTQAEADQLKAIFDDIELAAKRRRTEVRGLTNVPDYSPLILKLKEEGYNLRKVNDQRDHYYIISGWGTD